MNITREDDELVVRIPLKQMIYNCYDDNSMSTVDALVGVVAGQEYTLSHLIDMSYKDKGPQEGMPILYFDSREELKEVCKEHGIDIWEHPTCTHKGCGKVLRGVIGYGENGVECCEHEV